MWQRSRDEIGQQVQQVKGDSVLGVLEGMAAGDYVRDYGYNV